MTLTTTAPPRATAYTQPVPYLPGLDGLRALAVIAVVVYHGNVTWLRGGFLGVEVFFVISGYLITLLLLSEHRRSGRISLRRFWFRRARRLLPAVFALLLVVSAVSVVFVRDELDRLRGDLLAALTYTMNWHLIVSETSYFDQFSRPPLLRHLWSLAVEEQFYLLWPPVLAALLARYRKRPDRLFAVMAGAALVSSILMAVLYRPADPSRVYYGTDTRLAGLILGACLAVFWHPRRLAERVPPVRPRLVGTIGFVGLAGLAALCVYSTETGSFLYRGGFLLVDLATLAVIAAVSHPLVRFGRPLRMPILVYLGTRSYSIYLWHWPVFALTRPGQDIEAGPGPIFVLRMVITLVLAELSYRCVERPIRNGAIGRWGNRWRRSRGLERVRRTGRALLVTSAAGVAVYLLTSAIVSAKPAATEIEESIQQGVAVVNAQTLPSAVPGTLPDGGGLVPGGTGAPSTAPVPTGPVVGTLPPIETTTTVFVPPIETIAIGDSVMLGAAPWMLDVFGPDIYIDAEVSRQYTAAVEIVQRLKAERRFGSNVILHLGNNGTVSAETFNAVMEQLRDVPRVLVVNVRVTTSWEPGNNAVFAQEVGKYPNAKLADWWQHSACCGDWFYKDKTHLRAAGATEFTSFLQLSLLAMPGPKPATTTTTTAPPAATTTVPATTAAATPAPAAPTTRAP